MSLKGFIQINFCQRYGFHYICSYTSFMKDCIALISTAQREYAQAHFNAYVHVCGSGCLKNKTMLTIPSSLSIRVA